MGRGRSSPVSLFPTAGGCGTALSLKKGWAAVLGPIPASPSSPPSRRNLLDQGRARHRLSWEGWTGKGWTGIDEL